MQTFKELVKSKGMTQADLARKSGVSQRVISHWMSGRNAPTLCQAYYVACALGITLEELAIIFLNVDERTPSADGQHGTKPTALFSELPRQFDSSVT